MEDFIYIILISNSNVNLSAEKKNNTASFKNEHLSMKMSKYFISFLNL